MRRRSKWAAVILAVAVVVVAVLTPAPSERAGVLREELSTIFRPLVATVSGGVSSISSLWHHYIALTGTSYENDRLRQEVTRLHDQLQTLTETQAENERLRALLAMAEPWSRRPVGARVIAADPHHDMRTVVIDRGWADGIERDRPVMAGGGLIGRVRVLSEHSATVLLITDPNSAVDVLNARSRVRGLLVGSLRGTEWLRPVALTQVEYLTHDSDIREGDELLSSGMDGVYPKGLPLGRVQEVRRNEFGLFEEAWVVPMADLSRLEEVVIL